MKDMDMREIRNAAIRMAALSTAVKNAALEKIIQCLISNKERITSINAQDVARAKAGSLPFPIVKRLEMDCSKIDAVTAGIRSLIALEDPVGKQLFATELSEGLILRKVTCPIGVAGVIFESRPDALVQIACLCLKSGNAVILKGGSEASGTNRILTDLIKEATAGQELPDAWINQLETRSEIKEILKMDDEIDLLIPRGSYEFVRYVKDNTRIPVLGHSDGLCHCYVDAGANLDLAVRVAVDSKTQYVAVCNAIETLLVHRDAAPAFLPALWNALNGGCDNSGAGAGAAAGAKPYVSLRGCEETRRALKGFPVEAALESDWSAEYLDYTLSIKVVGSVKEAIDHINKYGSRHTDAIITEDADAAREFMLYVDSANVFHNCSTRFSDGFRYGFGAEVGVSTSKIHARGPVGLEGLVTYKYLLSGSGDTVDDYERGIRKFTHKPYV